MYFTLQNVSLIDMDIVNHENEPINKSNVQIEIANSRHNKPRRANTNITPQGTYFNRD